MMIFADYLVMFAVLLCISVNRQSIFILCAFAVNECAFYLTNTDFYFCIIAALSYAALAKAFTKIKYELQLSLALYSIFYWLSAFDYWVTEQVTIFYVIFPYVIKVIDIYVIYHLINKEQRNVGLYSANRCSFN